MERRDFTWLLKAPVRMSDCDVCEWWLQQAGYRDDTHKQGLKLFTPLLQVSIVFALTHHMTPGHGLFIRVVPDLFSPTIIKTLTQSCTQAYTMAHLLFPPSIREAFPPNLSWLKRAQVMMLAWAAWVSFWPQIVINKSLKQHSFPVTNRQKHISLSLLATLKQATWSYWLGVVLDITMVVTQL